MKWSDDQKKTARRLVANLIGVKDRVREMGNYQIKPDLFPEDMWFESRIYDIILYLHDNQIEPNHGNIVDYFLNSFDKPSDEVERQFESLLNYSTTDKDIAVLAFTLNDTLQKHKRIYHAQKMLELANDETLSGDDVYFEMLNHFQKLSPRTVKGTLVRSPELLDSWLEDQEQNYQLSISGKEIGPTFKWKSTRHLLPYMRLGEQTCIYAKPGYGKTTVAGLIAEFVAHEQGGYDVMYCHLETGAKTLMSRTISRKMLIPLQALEQAYYKDRNDSRHIVRMVDEPYKSRVDKIKLDFYKADRDMGNLIYFHCPGFSVEEIEIEVAKQKAKSEADGKRLLVIVDYLNKIVNKDRSENKAQAMNSVADKLKNMTETLGLYTLTMAQSQLDESYENKSDPRIREGNNIMVVSQNVIRLERGVALEDMLWKKDGKAVVNDFGEPIYLHKKDAHDSKIIMRLMKTNDNSQGITAENLILVGGYYRIIEGEEKTKPQPNLFTGNN